MPMLDFKDQVINMVNTKFELVINC